jgi:thiamine-phosphate diphosphorylase/hydroxyethylthiazole kinase
MGTLVKGSVENYLLAVTANNSAGNPVVFDPVGAAATNVRKEAVQKLLNGGNFDLIKGNESELTYIAQRDNAAQQAGVDSGPSTLSPKGRAALARDIASSRRRFSPLLSYLVHSSKSLAMQVVLFFLLGLLIT